MSANVRREARPPTRPSRARLAVLPVAAAALLLCAVTIVTFLPALRAEFLNWDDDKNFLANPHYRGLSPENLRWMFTTFHMGHYQPLSWMTLAVDYHLWRMDPRGYHLGNIVLHALNGLLAWAVIAALLRVRIRGDDRRSAAAVLWASYAGALLFAIHPLRVESVAWITERRDVLSGFFYLLTVGSYLQARRASRPASRRRWIVLSLAFFVLSLLSKAWGITLPIILLVLDAYPLGRFRKERLSGLLLEKAPYAALAAGAAALALEAQHRAGALFASFGEYTLLQRAAQSCYGVVFYLWKTVAPLRLSPMYLLDPSFRPFEPRYLLSAALVVAVTVLAVMSRKRAPWLLAAWAAFVTVLLPVLGFAQSGLQLVADRYTYLASLVLSALAAAGLARLWIRGGMRAPLGMAAAAAAGAFVVASAIVSHAQTSYWKDSVTLFSRALEVDPRNDGAYNNRALAYLASGNAGAALRDLDACLRINPNYVEAYANRAAARVALRDPAGALADCGEAIRLDPLDARMWQLRGSLRKEAGDLEGALEDLGRSVRLDPAATRAYAARGLALFAMNRMDEAMSDFDRALALSPEDPDARLGRGRARFRLGDFAGAVRDLDEAIRLSPGSVQGYLTRANALRALGDRDRALADLDEAVRRAPESVEALVTRAFMILEGGDPGRALTDFERALALDARNGLAYYGRGSALDALGEPAAALADYSAALDLLPRSWPARPSIEERIAALRAGAR